MKRVSLVHAELQSALDATTLAGARAALLRALEASDLLRCGRERRRVQRAILRAMVPASVRRIQGAIEVLRSFSERDGDAPDVARANERRRARWS